MVSAVVSSALLGLVLALLPGWATTTAEAAAPSHRAVLVFAKNHDDPFDSRLVWRLYERRGGGKERLVERRDWRAGAGLPGRGGKDPCVRSVGWPPDGSYRLTFHRDYGGSAIKGRAFRMDDKACRNGTVRQSLFIHTEQGAGSRQCADRPGDQLCRWEWPRINDYKSNGCLKMSPGDLRQLAGLFERRFSAGVHHSLDRVELQVRTVRPRWVKEH